MNGTRFLPLTYTVIYDSLKVSDFDLSTNQNEEKMKNLTTLVVFLIGSLALQAQSSIQYNPWHCDETNTNVYYANIGNRRVIVPCFANWPASETKQVFINRGGNWLVEPIVIPGGENLIPIHYVNSVAGYWDGYSLYLKVADENQMTSPIGVTTEANPSMLLEVTSITGGTISYRVSSSTGYSSYPSGWGSYPATCEDQIIMIITKGYAGTELILQDTVFCTPGVATSEERTFSYNGPYGQICMRSYLNRVVDHSTTYNIKASDQECFMAGQDLTTDVNGQSSRSKEINVFPNPSNGENFQITSPNSIKGWQAYDLTGKIVISGKGNTVDAGAMSPGTYSLKLTGVDDTQTTKMIVRQ